VKSWLSPLMMSAHLNFGCEKAGKIMNILEVLAEKVDLFEKYD